MKEWIKTTKFVVFNPMVAFKLLVTSCKYPEIPERLTRNELTIMLETIDKVYREKITKAELVWWLFMNLIIITTIIMLATIWLS